MAVLLDSPKILVVDDHIDTGRALVKLLNISGHSAQCIESGQKALDLLNTCEPRLLFLDMMMPTMGGLEVLKIIRNNERYKDLIIIMYSAWSDPAMIRDALALGADRYIVKTSLQYGALEQIVQEFLA